LAFLGALNEIPKNWSLPCDFLLPADEIAVSGNIHRATDMVRARANAGLQLRDFVIVAPSEAL